MEFVWRHQRPIIEITAIFFPMGHQVRFCFGSWFLHVAGCAETTRLKFLLILYFGEVWRVRFFSSQSISEHSSTTTPQHSTWGLNTTQGRDNDWTVSFMFLYPFLCRTHSIYLWNPLKLHVDSDGRNNTEAWQLFFYTVSTNNAIILIFKSLMLSFAEISLFNSTLKKRKCFTDTLNKLQIKKKCIQANYSTLNHRWQL